MNLLTETLEELQDNNKTIEDIIWIGMAGKRMTLEHFIEIADVEYDDGYGRQKVDSSLVIVGKGWWLEREAYDGSEWWAFKKKPTKPRKVTRMNHIIIGG